MKMKNLIKLLFGEVQFAEVKIMDSDMLLKSDSEDFVTGQPVYLISPDGSAELVVNPSEFKLEDGRVIVIDESGLVSEIKNSEMEGESENEDSVEVEVELENNPMETETEIENETETKMGEDYGKKMVEMEAKMGEMETKIAELLDKLEGMQKSLPENMTDEFAKIKKDIKSLKAEPIAETFSSQRISNVEDSFKNYLMFLKNSNNK